MIQINISTKEGIVVDYIVSGSLSQEHLDVRKKFISIAKVRSIQKHLLVNILRSIRVIR